MKGTAMGNMCKKCETCDRMFYARKFLSFKKKLFLRPAILMLNNIITIQDIKLILSDNIAPT